MRIGFLISGSLDTLSGGYIYDRQLVKSCQQQGHRIELIHFPGQNYPERCLQFVRMSLFKKLRSLSLDCLLQDELDHPALIRLNHKLKQLARYPIISIVHHLRSCEPRPGWQNQVYRFIEKQYLSTIDGFIFNSETTRLEVEKLNKLFQPTVTAPPCGDRLVVQITEQEIINRAKARGPLRILFLGNIIRRKGLHILLEAMTKTTNNEFFLTVAGALTLDKPYVRELRNQIQGYNLNDRVILLGSISNENLVSKLRESQTLVMPSYYEGFGIAYLEGMGCGLPAIGTTSGGAREIITHGKDGFLIPAGDSQSLARCLDELNGNRDHLAAMSLEALQRFKSHPTWRKNGEKVSNFLETFLPFRNKIQARY